MPRAEQVTIPVADLALDDPAGRPVGFGDLTGVQVVVLMRHRHQLPCQRHLVQVQKEHRRHGADPRIGLVLVGFSPADRLAAIARRLGWTGAVLSDPNRALYQRLGIGRAPWWRIYTPATLAVYARAWRRRWRPTPSQEDTRQLGGDAVVVDGIVRTLWRPHSPDDRPSAADVLTAAHLALQQTAPHGDR